MTSKSMTSLAFAAGCILALGAMPSAHAQYMQQPEMVTNGPQASAGDFGDWSARQNRIESRRYDRLLETNMAFRRHRERTECGPITMPSLREQCLASFQQYEPAYGAVGYGSSTAPMTRSYDEGAGYGSSANWNNEQMNAAGESESYNQSRNMPAQYGAGFPAPYANPTYPGPRTAGGHQ